jgi:hypothetical protein
MALKDIDMVILSIFRNLGVTATVLLVLDHEDPFWREN